MLATILLSYEVVRVGRLRQFDIVRVKWHNKFIKILAYLLDSIRYHVWFYYI
jgi:hypothetical protein